MYKIEKTNYGLKLTFTGFVDAEEMSRWAREVQEISRPMKKGFCVLLDLRGMAPLAPDAWEVMQKSHRRAMKAGMARSALVLDDPITTMQMKRLARQTAIDQLERYIDSRSNPKWEEVVMDWLIRGIEPNQTDLAATQVMRVFDEG
jgi:hypothetical protein